MALHEYLRQVRDELALQIGEDDARAATIEIEAHLRDRIAALMELGVPAEEAESEAIAKFGKPQKWLPRLAEALGPDPRHASKQIFSVALIASVVAALAVILAPSFVHMELFLLPIVCLLGVFAVSYRFGRFEFLRPVLACVAGSLLFWLGSAAAFLPLSEHGGKGYASRLQMDEFAELAATSRALRSTAVELDRTRDELLGAPDFLSRARALGLERDGLILVPDLKFGAISTLDYRVTYQPVSRTQAHRQWQEAQRTIDTLHSQATAFASTRASVQSALAALFGANLRGMTTIGMQFLLYWTGALMIAHLLGALAKRVMLELRRWRRGWQRV